MFKVISWMIAGCIGLLHLSAQETATLKINSAPMGLTKNELGIQGGPGISVFYNEHPMLSPRNVHRPVFESGSIGISYQHNFTRMLGLRVEASYERKGDFWYYTGGWVNSYTYSGGYTSDRINYISVPVMLRASFGRTVRFFIDGGLYGSARINAQRITRNKVYTPFVYSGDGVLSIDTKTRTDITKDISAMDAGAVVGLGLAFPVGEVATFMLEARNSTGLVSLNGNSGLYQNGFYNNNTSLLVGLSFPLMRHTQTPLK